MGKMALKKVCMGSDCAERLERKSRAWDIPESELIRRAVDALAKGASPRSVR